MKVKKAVEEAKMKEEAQKRKTEEMAPGQFPVKGDIEVGEELEQGKGREETWAVVRENNERVRKFKEVTMKRWEEGLTAHSSPIWTNQESNQETVQSPVCPLPEEAPFVKKWSVERNRGGKREQGYQPDEEEDEAMEGVDEKCLGIIETRHPNTEKRKNVLTHGLDPIQTSGLESTDKNI